MNVLFDMKTNTTSSLKPNINVNIQCDRLEISFICVAPTCRMAVPASRIFNTSSNESAGSSSTPATTKIFQFITANQKGSKIFHNNIYDIYISHTEALHERRTV